MRKLLVFCGVIAVMLLAVPTMANAATYKSEDQAEQYMIDNYSDSYWDDERVLLEDVYCDGYNRTENRYGEFRKFRCESDYSDDYGDGFTDVDVLRARPWGFKVRTIDSYWWN